MGAYGNNIVICCPAFNWALLPNGRRSSIFHFAWAKWDSFLSEPFDGPVNFKGDPRELFLLAGDDAPLCSYRFELVILLLALCPNSQEAIFVRHVHFSEVVVEKKEGSFDVRVVRVLDVFSFIVALYYWVDTLTDFLWEQRLDKTRTRAGLYGVEKIFLERVLSGRRGSAQPGAGTFLAGS